MNLLSSIVFAVALLGVALVVNGTLNHNYDNSRPLAQEVAEQQRPINASEIMNLKGTVVSLQNDDSGVPEWILSGRWQIEPKTTNSTKNNRLNQTLVDKAFKAPAPKTAVIIEPNKT